MNVTIRDMSRDIHIRVTQRTMISGVKHPSLYNLIKGFIRSFRRLFALLNLNSIQTKVSNIISDTDY